MTNTRNLMRALGFAVLSTVSAGCPPSPDPDPTPEPKVLPAEQFTVMMAMDDGVSLHTRVYVPERVGPVPTLLVRNPYAFLDDDDALAAAAQFHTERGYAYVWQSVRGVAQSEGTFTPYVNEVADGVATTVHITQEDWSNGRIGTMGGSYLSFTALAAAVDNPRVAIVISDDGTVDERSSHRGGPLWSYLLSWLHLVENSSFAPDAATIAMTNTRDAVSLDELVLGHPSAYWRDFIAEESDPLFPRTGSLELFADRLCVPVLHVYSPTTSWDDPVDIFRLLTTSACAEHRANQRLYVVTEPHTTHLSSLEVEPTYVNEDMLRVLDRVLLDGEADLGPGPMVSFHVVNEETPRTADAWPPPSTPRTFYFEGIAGEGPMGETPAESGAVSVQSDPDNDPCALGAPQWFTSAALGAPLVVAGASTLVLPVRSALADFDVFADLYDYDASTGSYVYIADARGSARVGAAGPLSAVDAVDLTLHFTHTAYRVPAGHQLTMSLAPSACGFIENPQSGEPFDGVVTAQAGSFDIVTGTAAGARLTLPVIEP